MDAKARLPEPSEEPKVIQAPNGVPVLMDDRSARARVLQIAALRGRGLSPKQIGEELGLQPRTIRTIIWRANRDGLIKYDDPYEHFEEKIVPKIVDNIEYFIDRRSEKMTIEAAKGAGIFKAHQALKVEGEVPQNILALKIEMPPGAGEPQIVTGRVVGKPRRTIKNEEEG